MNIVSRTLSACLLIITFTSASPLLGALNSEDIQAAIEVCNDQATATLFYGLAPRIAQHDNKGQAMIVQRIKDFYQNFINNLSTKIDIKKHLNKLNLNALQAFISTEVHPDLQEEYRLFFAIAQEVIAAKQKDQSIPAQQKSLNNADNPANPSNIANIGLSFFAKCGIATGVVGITALAYYWYTQKNIQTNKEIA